MLRITSKIDGFRRAGVAHSGTPTDYPDDFFTPAQLATLEAEPNLIIQQLKEGEATNDDARYQEGYREGYAKGVADSEARATSGVHAQQDSSKADSNDNASKTDTGDAASKSDAKGKAK